MTKQELLQLFTDWVNTKSEMPSDEFLIAALNAAIDVTINSTDDGKLIVDIYYREQTHQYLLNQWIQHAKPSLKAPQSNVHSMIVFGAQVPRDSRRRAELCSLLDRLAIECLM